MKFPGPLDDTGDPARQAMVQEAEQQLCVDRRRIFATGQSNGGMMTEQLGLDNRTAHLFAAGVQVSGAPMYGVHNPCYCGSCTIGWDHQQPCV